MGLNRLVIKPELLPYFERAVSEHREHRARTAAAWASIKHFVKRGDRTEEGPMEWQVEEVYRAVNASLAEYDLPAQVPACNVCHT